LSPVFASGLIDVIARVISVWWRNTKEILYVRNHNIYNIWCSCTRACILYLMLIAYES
jgi:hypothetical protein